MAALVRIAANLRAILAAHVALQFVDGRRLRPANGIERDGLMRVATEAADLKVNIPRVDRVPQRVAAALRS
jgi:hypothetical protein